MHLIHSTCRLSRRQFRLLLFSPSMGRVGIYIYVILIIGSAIRVLYTTIGTSKLFRCRQVVGVLSRGGPFISTTYWWDGWQSPSVVDIDPHHLQSPPNALVTWVMQMRSIRNDDEQGRGWYGRRTGPACTNSDGWRMSLGYRKVKAADQKKKKDSFFCYQARCVALLRNQGNLLSSAPNNNRHPFLTRHVHFHELLIVRLGSRIGPPPGPPWFLCS